MGFPHCPICLALAFFTFCVVVTRSYLIFLLLKKLLANRDEKEILMFLTYLPMSQQMNSVLYTKYLDQILIK